MRDRASTALVVAIGALSAATLILLTVHGHALPVMAAAALALGAIGAPRWGWLVALIGAAALILAAALTVAWVAAALDIALARSVAAVNLVVIGLAAGVLFRHPPTIPWRSVGLLSPVPIAWCGLVVASFVMPATDARSWAMHGDSSNNVLFSRDILAANGVAIGDGNPVPLLHVLLAVAFPDARTGTPAHQLVAADITSYALLWHALIVANMLLLGAFVWQASMRAHRVRPLVTLVAVALPQLVVFSWPYTGLAVERGFPNVHLSLSLVLASLVLSVSPVRNTLGAVGLHVLLGGLLLTAWPPLALAPLAAAAHAYVTWRRPERGRVARRNERVLVAIAGVLALAQVVVIVVTFGSNIGSVLSATGGINSLPMFVPLIGVAALGFASLLAPAHLRKTLWLFAGSLLAMLTGTWVLAGTEWTYYPQKLGWLVVALAISVVIALGSVAALRTEPVRRRSALLGFTAAATALVLLAPLTAYAAVGRGSPRYALAAVGFLTAPPRHADQLFGLVVSLTDSDELRLFWNVSEPLSDDANFWVLNLDAARYEPLSPERFRLRQIAYKVADRTATGWCEVGQSAIRPVVLLTDGSSDAQLDDECYALAPRMEPLPSS